MYGADMGWIRVQGMITLWDVEGGLPQLDKYLYSNDQAVVAGALLGVGIVNANVRVRICEGLTVPETCRCSRPTPCCASSNHVCIRVPADVNIWWRLCM